MPGELILVKGYVACSTRRVGLQGERGKLFYDAIGGRFYVFMNILTCFAAPPSGVFVVVYFYDAVGDGFCKSTEFASLRSDVFLFYFYDAV